MILIDTSVWIQYFRGKDQGLIQAMKRLLERDQVILAVPVWIELLSGASKNDFKVLKRVLSALPRLYPNEQTWELIESWIEKATPHGERFGSTDLLIAGIATQNKLSLWSLDQDFVRMEKLKMVELYSTA